MYVCMYIGIYIHKTYTTTVVVHVDFTLMSSDVLPFDFPSESNRSSFINDKATTVCLLPCTRIRKIVSLEIHDPKCYDE